MTDKKEREREREREGGERVDFNILHVPVYMKKQTARWTEIMEKETQIMRFK